MFKEVRGWSIHKLLCDERGPPKLVHRYQLAIMFLEAPAGVGFSYANRSSDLLNTGDRRTGRAHIPPVPTLIASTLHGSYMFLGDDFFLVGHGK